MAAFSVQKDQLPVASIDVSCDCFIFLTTTITNNINNSLLLWSRYPRTCCGYDRAGFASDVTTGFSVVIRLPWWRTYSYRKGSIQVLLAPDPCL